MTSIEKKLFAATIALIAIVLYLLSSVSDLAYEIDNNGGLKALVERAWEGKPND